jgi:hypothetical protein
LRREKKDIVRSCKLLLCPVSSRAFSQTTGSNRVLVNRVL